MTDTGGKSACTVRITVKLRPDEYDELFRHVCEIGSTMSAFFRQSAARAMKEEHPDTARSHPPPNAGLEENLADYPAAAGLLAISWASVPRLGVRSIASSRITDDNHPLACLAVNAPKWRSHRGSPGRAA